MMVDVDTAERLMVFISWKRATLQMTDGAKLTQSFLLVLIA
jgi:hypothetical protein